MAKAKTVAKKKAEPERIVLVRTYSAGVHVGVLESRTGRDVVLRDAHRVWRWRGANTLHELSQKGASQDYSRISERVPRIELTEAIEVIDCSPDAAVSLRMARWAA